MGEAGRLIRQTRNIDTSKTTVINKNTGTSARRSSGGSSGSSSNQLAVTRPTETGGTVTVNKEGIVTERDANNNIIRRYQASIESSRDFISSQSSAIKQEVRLQQITKEVNAERQGRAEEIIRRQRLAGNEMAGLTQAERDLYPVLKRSATQSFTDYPNATRVTAKAEGVSITFEKEKQSTAPKSSSELSKQAFGTTPLVVWNKKDLTSLQKRKIGLEVKSLEAYRKGDKLTSGFYDFSSTVISPFDSKEKTTKLLKTGVVSAGVGFGLTVLGAVSGGIIPAVAIAGGGIYAATKIPELQEQFNFARQSGSKVYAEAGASAIAQIGVSQIGARVGAIAGARTVTGVKDYVYNRADKKFNMETEPFVFAKKGVSQIGSKEAQTQLKLNPTLISTQSKQQPLKLNLLMGDKAGRIEQTGIEAFSKAPLTQPLQDTGQLRVFFKGTPTPTTNKQLSLFNKFDNTYYTVEKDVVAFSSKDTGLGKPSFFDKLIISQFSKQVPIFQTSQSQLQYHKTYIKSGTPNILGTSAGTSSLKYSGLSSSGGGRFAKIQLNDIGVVNLLDSRQGIATRQEKGNIQAVKVGLSSSFEFSNKLAKITTYDTPQKLETNTVQINKKVTKIDPPPIIPKIPSDPPPEKIIEEPIIPPNPRLKFLQSDTGKQTYKKNKRLFNSQPFKYTSTIEAGQFNIFGKKPKRLSGLELRPLIK